MYVSLPIYKTKCDVATLNVMDRQNAHNGDFCHEGIVGEDSDRETIVFSISHDHITLRIYRGYL